MADQTVDQIAPGGVVQLNDSPSALDDATFDSLFPTDGVSATPAAQPPAVSGTTPAAPAQPVAPVVQPTDAPYLQGRSSVYKTPEAAVEGINAKDALIDTLRQRYALTTGIDPITNQPIQQAPAAPQGPDYYQDPQKYLTDLYDAAKAGPQQYRDVQAKFLMDTLAPIAPAITRLARDQALETLKAEVPDAPGFIGTPVYQKALDSNPQLKEAILTAESDFRFHSRLPGLYKIAYLAGQGTQLPEILKANAPVQPQTPPPVRQTMQPNTSAPPAVTTRPNLKTIEGIRAVIADAEARGAKLEF